MREPGFRCELVSWGEVYRLTRAVAKAIRGADFEPDLIVAIARGGYVPARLLCDFLDIYDVTSIRIVHYTAGAQKQEQARLAAPLCVDVEDRKVLIVDDVSDTGDTLELSVQHLRDGRARDVRVAVLHHKQVATVQPEFYGKRVVKWRWITYPWALIEDITGFVRRMQPPPRDPESAARRLRKEYRIKVPRQTLEDVFQRLD